MGNNAFLEHRGTFGCKITNDHGRAKLEARPSGALVSRDWVPLKRHKLKYLAVFPLGMKIRFAAAV